MNLQTKYRVSSTYGICPVFHRQQLKQEHIKFADLTMAQICLRGAKDVHDYENRVAARAIEVRRNRSRAGTIILYILPDNSNAYFQETP